MMQHLNRRGFLKGLLGTGAFVLGVPLLGTPRLVLADGEDEVVFRPDLFVAIEASGAVRIIAHRSEMGTGIRSTLPAVLADELEADWARVVIEQAPGDAAYGSQNTDGSRSIRNFYQTMRTAGATARTMLEAAAAQTWEVEADSCRAELHEVVHAASGRRLGFGALVALAATLAVPEPASLRFKKPAERRYVGKSFKSFDVEDMVRGTAQYGLDVRREGMLYAVVARCPVYGGTLKSVDDSKARALAGVVDVRTIPDFVPPHAFQALGGVAVLATSTWAALEGRRRLVLEWDEGAQADFDSDSYAEELLKIARAPARVVREDGDVDAALAAAETVLEADYQLPFLAHAPMEPPCAVAEVSETGCEVWAPTQNPQAAQDTLAAVLEMPKEQVLVHVTLLGGGFGRKSKPDMICEAALLSRMAGKPVQVVWTREDDIRHDYYHAAAAVHMEAGLDSEGNVQALLMRSAFPTIASTFVPGLPIAQSFELMMGMTDLPWQVPNLRCESGEVAPPFRIGWLRSVCNIFHAFAGCVFVDELATTTGQDPVAFALKLLGEDRVLDLTGVDYPNYGVSLEDFPIETGRLRHVIELVAAKGEWGRKLPAGHGLGFAVHRSFLSCIAVVVEVAVDGKKIRIPRVDMAIDCGLVVHPDRVRAQMEGSAVFGASIALSGKISAKNGRIVEGNFDTYPVVRMHEAPREINVHMVASEAAPVGVGEPGVPPMAPAIVNALFAATGKRVRRLPILSSPDWKD